jgi:flagellin
MRIGDSGGFGDVLLNLSQNQAALGTLTNELSSGLRINTAADDPSGYAIASNLMTVSQSLTQGTQSIQNANNLINVANGAMSTIIDILQRCRSLTVEANSDLNSASDLANIQTELNQLVAEINTISQNANFNGLNLFNGNLTTTPPNLTNPILFVVNPLTSGSTTIPPPPDTSPPSGPPLITETQATGTSASNGGMPIDVQFTVESFDSATDSLTISYTAESPDSTFGPAQTASFQVAEGTNFPVGFPGPFPPNIPLITIFSANGLSSIGFNFNNINRNDVGLTATFASVNAQNYQQGPGAAVNTGTGEGSTIPISIPAISAFNLGVSLLNVSDTLQTTASEGRIDNALSQVTSAAAELGAQAVTLNEASNNNQVYQLNLTASASNITDVNVGTATTEFTKTQILVSVGTSVLSQMEVDTKQLASILIDALNVA